MLWKEAGRSIWSIHCQKSILSVSIPSQITCCGGPALFTMQQSTSCRREDEWKYGNGKQQWWRMTTVVDNDDMRDWAADCNGEGRERAVRDIGDSGVVMMAVAAEDGCGGQQQ
jgi:hypothetical protein